MFQKGREIHHSLYLTPERVSSLLKGYRKQLLKNVQDTGSGLTHSICKGSFLSVAVTLMKYLMDNL